MQKKCESFLSELRHLLFEIISNFVILFGHNKNAIILYLLKISSSKANKNKRTHLTLQQK